MPTLGRRDLYRIGLTVGGQPGAIDLVALPNGWLVRAVARGGNVLVAVSRDAGVTWGSESTVASDAADPSSVSLEVTRYGEVLLCYHTTAALKLLLDDGSGWAAHATHSGLEWGRYAQKASRGFLAAWDGSELKVYPTEDYGATLGTGVSISGATEGQPALRVDRQGALQLIYTAGADLKRRWSGDGLTWSSPADLGAGAYPALAIGLSRAVVAHYAAGALTMRTTDPAFQDSLAAAGEPTATWSAGYGGLIPYRDGATYWCGEDTAHQSVLSVSFDDAATWAVAA